MARARATENPRTRPKSVLIEEISRGIEQLQDILTAIEDFSREGFPYRDAARAKAELQLRECVRRIFGERSSEFQTCRHYRLRTNSKEETAQSLGMVRSLVQTLEDKKLDLQGIKTTAQESVTVVSAPILPSLSAASATIAIVPVTEGPSPVPAPPERSAVIPTVTASVPSAMSEQPPRAMPDASVPIPPVMAQPVPVPTTETAPAPIASMELASRGSSDPSSGALLPEQTDASPTTVASASSIPAGPAAPHSTDDNGAHSPAPSGASVTAPLPPSPATSLQDPPTMHFSHTANITPGLDVIASSEEPDALERLRKVCLRFHAVARQLRLRKDYRATLDVEDDYDLQDLLCALLRVEFDEVGTDEWTPPYAGGGPRTAFLLHGDRIAVIAKKTRPGLTATDLAHQLTADSARYTSRDHCRTLFCFIYDPEGRIGSPKRLETDLTSVSDRYMIDVLVAPK